jgi:type VI secretion system lysozyme-like protein
LNLFQIEPRSKPLASVPLWNRFVESEVSELGKTESRSQFLTAPQLIDSVIQEISNLLDTRVSMRWDRYEAILTQTPMALPYGIPDFNTQILVSGSQLWKVKKTLETVVRHFEPRLNLLQISVHSFNLATQNLPITIIGSVWIRPYQQKLSFDLDVRFLS